MNIVHVDDATFERKVSRMSVAELERALQALNTHLANYKASTANYSYVQQETYSKPHIARHEGRIASVQALLRTRS